VLNYEENVCVDGNRMKKMYTELIAYAEFGVIYLIKGIRIIFTKICTVNLNLSYRIKFLQRCTMRGYVFYAPC
jgi:hypothetical protein